MSGTPIKKDTVVHVAAKIFMDLYGSDIPGAYIIYGTNTTYRKKAMDECSRLAWELAQSVDATEGE